MSVDSSSINPSDHQIRIMQSSTKPSSPLLESTTANSDYSSMDSKSNLYSENNSALPKTPTVKGSTYSYEELSNGLPCPTCHGTGKIPRGQEDDLVALIPYNDKRLKPRRTWLYVFLSVFLCLLLAGILCAFLIPRSIEVVNSNVTTEHVALNLTENKCRLSLQSVYKITNNNFVSVMTNDIALEVTVTFSQALFPNKKYQVHQKISLRSTQQVLLPFNITLTNKVFPIQYCQSNPLRGSYLYMKFQSTLNFTLMAQTDQQLITSYFFVSCRSTQNAAGSDYLLSLEAIDKREYPELGQEY